jgi:hypothetical protein
VQFGFGMAFHITPAFSIGFLAIANIVFGVGPFD